MDSEEPKAKKQRISPAEGQHAALDTQLLVKRLSERARLPKRGSALAAGYDIYR
jgi:dUTP pyrophosphatase